ncbi:MAG: LicD family protein [Candidatus Tectomicrobia bacterium]|nr:LicD family protein [Candidatus Tectomicrobia bacterium]
MDHLTNDLQAFECVWSVTMWQLAERMLYDLDRVLRAHGIRVFMVYGTFLGAIRHQGVIPWDDDIDVGIFGEDESRLLHAQGDLLTYGYRLKRHQIQWDESTLDYYKVWIASRPSRTSYPYSWPFVDIWVFRPTDQLNESTDGYLCFQDSDILPLKPYPFGNLSLAGPCSEALLVQAYGEDYLETCVSTYWNHREEKRLTPVSKSREEVEFHGYFVQVHTRDSTNYPSQ